VLIDDVITTGATLRAAAGLIAGPTSAVTATAAVSPLPEVTSLPAASFIPVWR
jgi:adenine/guanine phosphoribosyltransferase-like PRPP-binding protein